MTEFVRVRQFDSEGGGGWQILSGRLFIFCMASATNPEYFGEHFLKAKRNKHILKKRGGGRRRGAIGCFMFSLCWFV